MLLMFVLELQLNRRLLLRKRRINHEEFAFQVGSSCLRLFITVRLEKLEENPCWYSALKHSESHRLLSKCCFCLVPLTCLGPRGTRLERKCKLLWWFPVKSHMNQGLTHWLLLCSWIPSPMLPQLCLPFSAKPILANGLDNPALGGCEAERSCPKAAVAPGGCRQFVVNPKYKPPDKSRIWG